MSKVSHIKGPAADPDHVLKEAIGEFDDVILVGYDAEGILDVRASMGLDHKEILFMLEQFKHKLIAGHYSE